MSMFNPNNVIVLASNSPRRRDLLQQMRYKHRFVSLEVEENYPSDMPVEDVPEYLAIKKSNAYHSLHINEVLLTADTDVIYNNQVLGKPKSKQEALEKLLILSGQTHKVITGVCLKNEQKLISFTALTTVTFYEIKPSEIEYYLSHYNVMDKAGAYAIQEWIGLIGVKSIEGEYNNIVGLPTAHLHQVMQKEFLNKR